MFDWSNYDQAEKNDRDKPAYPANQASYYHHTVNRVFEPGNMYIL